MLNSKPAAEPTGRLSGGLLVAAALIMFTGAGIAVLSPSLNDAVFSGDLQRSLSSVASSPIGWMWVNGLIAGAGILTSLGLVVLSLRFGGPGRRWAWMGMTAFAFAAVFLAIDRILGMSVRIWAAERLSDPTVFTVVEGFRSFDRVLSDWFEVLSFLSLGLYGIALTQTAWTRQRGWVFVAVGVVGVVLSVAGGVIPGMIFLGTGALGVATWNLELRSVRE